MLQSSSARTARSRGVSPPTARSIIAAATAATTLLWGTTLTGILAAVGLALLLVWLLSYALVTKPINTTLTAAALAEEVPTNARALQARWESLLPLRVSLLAIVIALLAATLAVI